MSQALRPPSTPWLQVPRQIQQPKLGATRAVFHQRGARLPFVLAAGLLLYVVGTVLSGADAPYPPGLYISTPALVLLVTAACVVAGLWRNAVLAQRRLYIYERGFASVDGSTVLRCGWDEVIGFERRAAGGVPVPWRRPVFVVQRRDGACIVLAGYRGEARLAELLTDEISRAQALQAPAPVSKATSLRCW